MKITKSRRNLIAKIRSNKREIYKHQCREKKRMFIETEITIERKSALIQTMQQIASMHNW